MGSPRGEAVTSVVNIMVCVRILMMAMNYGMIGLNDYALMARALR